MGKLPDSEFDGIRSGYFEVAFAVKETEKTLSLKELRDGLQEISRTGQRAMIYGDALHHRSKPVEYAIESVCPTNDEEAARGYDGEYLRFRSDGFLYYAGQYNYDHKADKPNLFINWPIVSVGRLLVFASAACKLWDDEPKFLFGCRFTGLEGRHLSDPRNQMFIFHNRSVCKSPEVTLQTIELATEEVEDGFADILHEYLFPLYEHFDYFQLSRELVA